MKNLLILLVRSLAAVVVIFVGLGFALAAFIEPNNKLWSGALSVVVIAGGALSFPRRPNAWKNDPPTDRQIAFAENLGIIVPDGVTKGELSSMISQVTGR